LRGDDEACEHGSESSIEKDDEACEHGSESSIEKKEPLRC